MARKTKRKTDNRMFQDIKDMDMDNDKFKKVVVEMARLKSVYRVNKELQKKHYKEYLMYKDKAIEAKEKIYKLIPNVVDEKEK